MDGDGPEWDASESSGAGSSDEESTASSEGLGSSLSRPLEIDRREALKAGGLFGGGVLVGASIPDSRSEWCTATVPPEYGIDTDFWLTDERLQDRPLWSLSLPGTHHAPFYELTANWLDADSLTERHVERWTKTQSRSVARQLRDGIRWLDVRVHYDPETDAQLWGHHELARGASLVDVFTAIGEFLDEAAGQSGSELLLIKFSHFDGFDDGTGEAGVALQQLLEEHLGDYALSLPAMEPPELLDRSLGSFDGPRVGLFYDGLDPWPGVADPRERWVRDGWVNEPGLDEAHEAATAMTDDAVDRFGEVGYYITPPTGRIASSVVTGWVPGSRRWLSYRSLEDAANRMGTRFPCYVSEVRLEADLNPNIVTVDYYQTSAVVRACQELSLRGLHGYE